MTAPQPTGTALVETTDDNTIIGKLPQSLQDAIRIRKMENITRRAVAEWCRLNDIDPITELEILGNKFYRNAAWHLRKLAEMAARGVVQYAMADHVEDDPRLTALMASTDSDVAKRALQEQTRRIFQRIDHQIPDQATGAVVFRVKLWNMDQEVVGVAYCGGGTKSKVVSGGAIQQSAAFDPIGEAEPAKTAESRAARRCVRMIATHRPDLAAELTKGQDDALPIQARIQETHDELKKQRPSWVQTPIMDPSGRPRLPAGQIETTVITELKQPPKRPMGWPEGKDPLAEEPPKRTADEQAAFDLDEDRLLEQEDRLLGQREPGDEDDAA
jgi:hypothetical protein